MSRMYAVLEESSSLSGTIIPIELLADSGHVLALHSFYLGIKAGAPVDEEIVKVFIARYSTASSGGSSVTPAQLDPSDPAASFSASAFHTSPGTAGAVLHVDSFNVRAGWQYRPTPEERLYIPPSGRLAVVIGSVINAYLYEATAYVEEI